MAGTKRNKTKKALPKKPENRQIIVTYSSNGAPLTENQKKNLIKHFKKDRDYVVYLSGKFKYSFADDEVCTQATYVWKGGAGNWNEAYDRVMNLLSSNLPTGIVSESIVEQEV